MSPRPTLYAGVVIVDDDRVRVDHDEWVHREFDRAPVGRCAATACGGLLFADEPDAPPYSTIIYYTARCGDGHEYLYVNGRVRGGPLPEPVPQRDITEPLRENQ